MACPRIQGAPLKAEGLHELLAREELLLTAIVPAQKGQEVDHRVGQVALLLKIAHGRRAVALGQLGVVGRQQQGDVAEQGHLKAQGGVDQHLRRG